MGHLKFVSLLKSRRLRAIRIIGYFVYLVLISLIVFEILLRALGYHGESDQSRLIQHHEALGWLFIPNTDAVDTSFEWKVQYHINVDGFREKAKIKEKTKDIYRILILGDSFTEGFGIPENKRFSVLTEYLLKQQRPGVEIINLGVRGYNLAQYYQVFQMFYEKYNPDLVIIAAVLADLDVVASAYPLEVGRLCGRPHFHLQNEELVLDGVPVFKLYEHSIWKNDKLAFLKEKYLRHCAIWCFLKTITARNCFLKKICLKLNLEKDPAKYPEYEKFSRRIYNSAADPMLYDQEINEKVSAAILKKMLAALKSGGGKLLVFLLVDDDLQTNASFYRRTSGQLGFYYASFAKLCHEYKQNKRKYHFKFEPHFNEAGNVLVAGSLADFIAKKVWPDN